MQGYDGGLEGQASHDSIMLLLVNRLDNPRGEEDNDTIHSVYKHSHFFVISALTSMAYDGVLLIYDQYVYQHSHHYVH